jgi:PTS system ascorbate-specific IIB component
MTVCGAGVGSSLMIKINVDELLQKLKIKGRVINSDIASAKTNTVDIVITSEDIYALIKSMDVKEVVILQNIVSMKELEEKLVPALTRVLGRDV